MSEEKRDDLCQQTVENKKEVSLRSVTDPIEGEKLWAALELNGNLDQQTTDQAIKSSSGQYGLRRS